MAAKLGFLLDCADPERLAEFWSTAIGYTTLGGAGNYCCWSTRAASSPSSSCSASASRRPARTECAEGCNRGWDANAEWPLRAVQNERRGKPLCVNDLFASAPKQRLLVGAQCRSGSGSDFSEEPVFRVQPATLE